MITTTTPFADTQRVLDAISRRTPRAAARAAAMLRFLLRDVESSSCPEYTWSASSLTGDGYPVEFTFTTHDNVVRYTVAPWPEQCTRERVARALQTIDALCSAAVPGPVADALLRLSVGLPEGAAGAWIGGRHDEDARTPDRLKLYVQPGPGAPPAGALRCDGVPKLEERAVSLRLYGYEPASGVHERYYRIQRLRPYHLRALMSCAGLEHRAAELSALIRDAYGHPIDAALPGGSVGCSIAGRRDGPVQFTLYVFARALWGGDRRIRLAVARVGAAVRAPLEAYLEASAPLNERDVHLTHHGMAGFVVGPEGPIHVAIGLRPPPLRPDL